MKKELGNKIISDMVRHKSSDLTDLLNDINEENPVKSKVPLFNAVIRSGWSEFNLPHVSNICRVKEVSIYLCIN